MPRGGRRGGKPGVAYQNRTDLNSAANKVGPSQQYGDAAAKQRQLQALPIQTQVATPAQAPVARPNPGGPPPGSLGDFLRPTERPNEPLTAGIPMGAGPGPEALGSLQQSDPDQEDMLALAPKLPMLELVANLPDTSVATRNFVRRLRGAVPPEALRG